jgi:hypothetical protein
MYKSFEKGKSKETESVEDQVSWQTNIKYKTMCGFCKKFRNESAK